MRPAQKTTIDSTELKEYLGRIAMTGLSHVELYVSNDARSSRFYDSVLTPLGWKRFVCQRNSKVDEF